MRVVRCVCHAVPVEGIGCRGEQKMHVDRLLQVCSVGRLLLVCFGAVYEGVVLTVITAFCTDNGHRHFLHSNIPLQSPLTPFVV